MHIAEVVTIAKSLPLLRLNTYKSLILSYSADYRRILRKNNTMLDYFFIDYTFELLYQKNLSFKKIVDETPFSNQHIYTMTFCDIIKSRFQEGTFDTSIFKLNRKSIVH